jgi:hypothetical protein
MTMGCAIAHPIVTKTIAEPQAAEDLATDGYSTPAMPVSIGALTYSRGSVT